MKYNIFEKNIAFFSSTFMCIGLFEGKGYAQIVQQMNQNARAERTNKR